MRISLILYCSTTLTSTRMQQALQDGDRLIYSGHLPSFLWHMDDYNRAKPIEESADDEDMQDDTTYAAFMRWDGHEIPNDQAPSFRE